MCVHAGSLKGACHGCHAIARPSIIPRGHKNHLGCHQWTCDTKLTGLQSLERDRKPVHELVPKRCLFSQSGQHIAKRKRQGRRVRLRRQKSIRQGLRRQLNSPSLSTHGRSGGRRCPVIATRRARANHIRPRAGPHLPVSPPAHTVILAPMHRAPAMPARDDLPWSPCHRWNTDGP